MVVINCRDGGRPTYTRGTPEQTDGEHTWSANKFSLYWLQTLSLSHARMQSDSIVQWIGTRRKA